MKDFTLLRIIALLPNNTFFNSVGGQGLVEIPISIESEVSLETLAMLHYAASSKSDFEKYEYHQNRNKTESCGPFQINWRKNKLFLKFSNAFAQSVMVFGHVFSLTLSLSFCASLLAF